MWGKSKIRNFFRNIKGRYDLFRILFHWDREYRKEIIVVMLALILINYSITDLDSIFDLVALVLEGGILLMQMGSELSILPAQYRSSYAGVSYSAKPCTHVSCEELSFGMAEVKACKAEAGLNFYNPAKGKELSAETLLVSDQVDDVFMLKDKIPYELDQSANSYIYSSHQIKYLAIRVANRLQHTTNEEKLALYADISDIIGDKPLMVRKSYYFDALLTAEAFRSHIFRQNLLGEDELYIDLTNYFPVNLAIDKGRSCIQFQDNFYKKVSGHIGITTLLLTEKNQVAMLFQGKSKAIDANKVALGGSGSMDFKDAAVATETGDLRDALVHSMARELCEETGKKHYMEQAVKNTYLTGFFRWVDRSGKPEFCGITKAGTDMAFSGCNSVDGDEITKFEEIPVTVNEMADFKKVWEYLKDENITTSLSSVAALHRLIVIADYNNADATADQKKVYSNLSKFLFS